MIVIQEIDSGHDKNGNPRRAYCIYKVSNECCIIRGYIRDNYHGQSIVTEYLNEYHKGEERVWLPKMYVKYQSYYSMFRKENDLLMNK